MNQTSYGKPVTTYEERFADAVTLLCRLRPPADMVEGWLARGEDHRLQNFAASNGPSWCQGIVLLDAAHVIADQPEEGEGHLDPQEAPLPNTEQNASTGSRADAWFSVAGAENVRANDLEPEYSPDDWWVKELDGIRGHLCQLTPDQYRAINIARKFIEKAFVQPSRVTPELWMELGKAQGLLEVTSRRFAGKPLTESDSVPSPYSPPSMPGPYLEIESYTPGAWYQAKTRDELQAFFQSRLRFIREAALEHGYAIGLHGSMRRDLDLIAVPWREGASDKDVLAHAIAIAACGITREADYQWTEKPLGRLSTSIPCCWAEWYGETGTGHIDLSVIVSQFPHAAIIPEGWRFYRDGDNAIIIQHQAIGLARITDLSTTLNQVVFALCDDILKDRNSLTSTPASTLKGTAMVETTIQQALDLLVKFDKYFTSLNGVDVPERVSVSRDEWRALRTAVVAAAIHKVTKSLSGDFIRRTNEDYAAWCKTHYVAEALDARGHRNLDGLWAWQEQERRKDSVLANYMPSDPVAYVDDAGVIVVCNYKYKPGDKLYTLRAPTPTEPDGITYLYRRKGLNYWCTCSPRSFQELSQLSHLYETVKVQFTTFDGSTREFTPHE